MPPQGPLRKDDGPICRACGCTRHNACVGMVQHHEPADDYSAMLPVTCSWVTVDMFGTEKPLCSACAGTVDDAIETIRRVNKLLAQKQDGWARRAGLAFINRNEARKAGKYTP